jgi:hypothetical protein
MDWSNLLDALKLSPRYLVPVALASGFLLFSPADYLTVMGLDTLVNSYRSWIGLVFLVSAALLITSLIQQAWSLSKVRYARFRTRRAAHKRLNHLTAEEKDILRGYIVNQTRTQVLDFASGVVKGLEHEGIIYQASPLGSLLDGFAYNIQPWAWDYLNDHKELLIETNSGSDGIATRSSPLRRKRRW